MSGIGHFLLMRKEGGIATFGTLFFAAYLTAAVLFGAGFEYQSGGFLWLSLALLFWTIGATVGASIKVVRFSDARLSMQSAVLSPPNWFLFVLCIIGAFQVFAALSASGFSVANFLLNSLVAASERYSGTASNSNLAKLSLIAVYTASILAGLKAGNPLVKKKWLLLLFPILIAAALGLSQNAKATVLYSLALWGGGFLTVSQMVGRTVFGPRKVIAFLIAVVLVGVLFFFMQWLRYGGQVGGVELTNILSVYAFAQISAFSIWYEVAPSIELGLGTETFRSIVGAFIGTSDIQGYERFIAQVSDNYSTTVITGYAELIKDFGRVGSLGVVFILGLLTAQISRNLTRCVRGSCGLACLVYASIIFFPITSLLNYTTLLLSFVLVGLLDLASRHKHIDISQ